ncbi:SH3 domain-binding protein 5 homolog [Tribolium castaneum]|uniref:SH3 domain-binding protein 5 homolog-like Protein n=1 Tax=Tribolium castaneum TaxID=7070 RepID=D6X1K7_TRICA|nr:PREDICTED: SH3 domain-binding protein 5 homolog [Tribolium castaneum]EFA09348.1 SH3 domain-binding protein 5 homolog-like Protein [Tribolium castaneum]|eukprot:XP_008198596.1 PREDICTED: SH3 domain-binding protein 5 homolog [Tribolium castaneum]
MSENEDNELDPRIQIELEKLNTTTDEINRLEIEYDEANTTFRMLLNESTRRLKILSKKLGSCIERARPYYEALEIAKKAQQECQKAAVQFQRANEIHAAAKETVALAEQRFLSNQHEWQFDNAWQEMLNHATIKVMEAENQKAESGREHQRRATIFKTAEDCVKQLESRLQKSIIKSRPYFDEKSLCQQQLNTQKDRIETIKRDIVKTKSSYAQTLKQLEQISNEIHMKRGSVTEDILRGPREPGVGAELAPSHDELGHKNHSSLPDFNLELEKCELRSCGSSSTVSEKEELSEDLDELKVKFKELATRPVNGGEGESMDGVWESELKSTVEKMDHMMLLQECAQELDHYKSEIKDKVIET